MLFYFAESYTWKIKTKLLRVFMGCRVWNTDLFGSSIILYDIISLTPEIYDHFSELKSEHLLVDVSSYNMVFYNFLR